MKKFLMYSVVLVVMLFIGYTTYYFIRNNETINLTLAEGESICINKDETYELPINWTKPYSSTKVYENVVISDENIVTFDPTTKLFRGRNGGVASVTVTPSNEEFGPFRFDVRVGDGSVQYPYYIQTELELSNIGNTSGETYQLSDSYILVKDIDLKSFDNWTPIGTALNPFSGTFDGNGKAISNLKITTGADVGLFAALSQTAVVSDLTITNAVISGSFDNAGAVAGINNGIIRRCNVVDFSIVNSKDNSNNGSVVGKMLNNFANNEFVSGAYIDMCTTSVTAECAGNFGGLVGSMTGSVIYNSKSTVTNYTTLDNSLYFGSMAGVIQDATGINDYMFNVIKNSYSIINSINATNASTKLGAIVGKNIDSVKNGYSNIIKSVYYHSVISLDTVADSETTINVTTVYHKAVQDFYSMSTFDGWDFENVWTTQDDLVLNQIQDGAQAQPLNEYIPGAVISTQQDLQTILDAIIASPSSGKVYEIDTNLTLDLNGAEWTTIAPDINNPLTCSLICNDGVTLTFKNFKISGQNSSFFGYISRSSTMMKGINFEDVTVNSDAEQVGVIATGLIDSATLENCSVKNSNITTSATTKNIGIISAVNYGNIKSCKVNENASQLNTVTSSSLTMVMGGIVAVNYASVTNSSVSAYKFTATNEEPNSDLKFGGIAGHMINGKLTDCYNYDSSIESQQIGIVYAGGVAGYITDESAITKCFSEGKIELQTSQPTSYAGGVCAYSSVSPIKQSYFANSSLIAYNTAGICTVSTSDINQCYFKGEVKGVIVAGLVSENNKTIRNCSADGSITGLTKNSYASGICTTLPVGSLVENCFSNMTFDACEGYTFAETEEQFRISEIGHWVGGLFNKYPETGDLKNCIIINYGDAARQGSVIKAVIGKQYEGWIDCTNDEALGLTGNYSKFKNDAAFDQTLWIFDNNNGEGAYPTLRHVVVNPQTISAE